MRFYCSVYGETASLIPSHTVMTNNFIKDVMHDFLEGIVPLVLKLVIKKSIEDQIITLDELNLRIQSFSYGLTDKKNCPSPITLTSLQNSKGPSGQKAAQTQCLLKYICLLCLVIKCQRMMMHGRC